MDANLRKKSPRAPSLSLDDAVERTARLYEKEGRHPTSTDVVAQGLGYKDSNNGRAAQMLASLRYYGLVERPKDGHLAVSKDFESYQFAPDPAVQHDLLVKWLTTPPVFAELLGKYESRLPSDATIKFDLIQKGFAPSTADTCVALFRRSVEYAKYFDVPVDSSELGGEVTHGVTAPDMPDQAVDIPPRVSFPEAVKPRLDQRQLQQGEGEELVRIPIRLPKGRQAWLEIPIPFYEADKARLKAYIDLQLTDDEDDGSSEQGD